jgi:hypothetical protein
MIACIGEQHVIPNDMYVGSLVFEEEIIWRVLMNFKRKTAGTWDIWFESVAHVPAFPPQGPH